MNQEAHLKHLEFIQGIITRLAANSFSLKTWAVTIAAATFALAAKDADVAFVYIALVPTIAFWALDAYYLRLERQYRKLYDAVRYGTQSVPSMDLDAAPYRNHVPNIVSTVLSLTLVPFYGGLTAVICVVVLVNN